MSKSIKEELEAGNVNYDCLTPAHETNGTVLRIVLLTLVATKVELYSSSEYFIERPV